MEYHIQLQFEKLSIPLIEPSTCIIELSFSDKKLRYDYPLASPITLALPFSFSSSSQNPKHSISLTIMLKLSKKYKKIAHGELNLYKRYFTSDTSTVDKWVSLSLYQTQLETMGHSTDAIKAALNKGKIFVKLVILDFAEVKKKFLPKESSLQSNKPDHFRGTVDNANEPLLSKTKQSKPNSHIDDPDMDDEVVSQKEFEDGLSELSISIVDVNEDDREGLELTEFINEDYLGKLKHLIENDYDSILPKDVDKLKQLNEMLYQKYSELNCKYNEVLTALSSENEEMRKKAKWYYDSYKEMKREVFKGRKELRTKQHDLQKAIHANSAFNKKVIDNVVRYRNEVNEMREKLGINSADNGKEGEDEDSEMQMMCDLLRKALVNGAQRNNICNRFGNIDFLKAFTI